MLADDEDVTIFITTHNMEEAEKLCDQVAVIQAGEVVAQGKPEDLKANLGSNRIEITGKGFTTQILELVRKNPHVTRLESLNGHLAIELAGRTEPSEIVSMLVNNGAQIEEVHRTKASLEEVFLKLTGEDNV